MELTCNDDHSVHATLARKIHDFKAIPSVVSFSSESSASQDRSTSGNLGDHPVAARRRRSRALSMREGSDGALEFFGTPASDIITKVNATGKLDTNISEGYVEGGDEDKATQEPIELVLHPTKPADDKILRTPAFHADGQVGTGCQCIVL